MEVGLKVENVVWNLIAPCGHKHLHNKFYFLVAFLLIIVTMIIYIDSKRNSIAIQFLFGIIISTVGGWGGFVFFLATLSMWKVIFRKVFQKWMSHGHSCLMFPKMFGLSPIQRCDFLCPMFDQFLWTLRKLKSTNKQVILHVLAWLKMIIKKIIEHQNNPYNVINNTNPWPPNPKCFI